MILELIMNKKTKFLFFVFALVALYKLDILQYNEKLKVILFYNNL